MNNFLNLASNQLSKSKRKEPRVFKKPKTLLNTNSSTKHSASIASKIRITRTTIAVLGMHMKNRVLTGTENTRKYWFSYMMRLEPITARI